MTLTSAPLEPIGPEDHLIGSNDDLTLVFYGDYDCPFCAAAHDLLRPGLDSGRFGLVFRHFPLTSAHQRAEAAHRAAEAAALQDRFWPMHQRLFDNPGRLEDPDLWRYAEQSGLDLDKFNLDRRTDAVWDRVQHDFMTAIRGGVKEAPTLAAPTTDGFSLLAGPLSSERVDLFLQQIGEHGLA